MKLFDSYRNVEIDHPEYTLNRQLAVNLGLIAQKKGLHYMDRTIHSSSKILTVRMLKDIKGKSNLNLKKSVLYLSLHDLFYHDTVWDLIKSFFGK